MNNEIDKLAEYFEEFPGIGKRQSKRFVYFLLSQNNEYIKNLSKSISELKKNISECINCHVRYPANGKSLCDYCNNPANSKTELIVIEKDADYENVRKSRTFTGQYFILGGNVPIVEKATPKLLRVNELSKRVDDLAKQGLNEIILAFSLTPSGENTDTYIRSVLRPLAEKYEIKVSSLGRGLSTGTELEYSDSLTIKNALKNRS